MPRLPERRGVPRHGAAAVRAREELPVGDAEQRRGTRARVLRRGDQGPRADYKKQDNGSEL